MYTTLTLTSVHYIVPSLFFFSSFSLSTDMTQLSCTIHSLTSVHAHLDRTGLESIVFSETSAVILSSCNHIEPFKGPIIPFEQRLSVTRFQYEISQDFNGIDRGRNLERRLF